jgi:hypothetical protein
MNQSKTVRALTFTHPVFILAVAVLTLVALVAVLVAVVAVYP